MLSASILVVILLFVGHALRSRFTVFDRIYIPASVIAGVVGLAVIQFAGYLPLPTQIAAFLEQAANSLKAWPATLIAVVFAAMLLQRSSKSLRLGLRATGCEAMMVWIIALGQTAIGVTLTWLVIQPLYDVPNAFGMLIETGFAGGHGTAAAMGQIFKTPEIAFPVGHDLGLLMATAGLVYGTISGIFWINVAMRLGLASHRPPSDSPVTQTLRPPTGLPGRKQAESTTAGGPAGERPAAVEQTRPRRLLLQFVWISLAYLVGIGLQSGVGSLAQRLDAAAPGSAAAEPDIEQRPEAPVLEKLRLVSLVGNFPLFIYTLFGGLMIARLLMYLGRGQLMDGRASGRISGVAMDLLVVAAISTLNLEAVAAFLLPVTILFAGGAIWAAVCLFALSPRILPRSHWFELGLINYGMSTGVTATGFVLLRLVDPQLQTDAAKHYALAAPLSAPFVGGGVITIGLPLLVLQRVPIGISALVLSGIVLLLVAMGTRLARSASPAAE